MRNLKEKYYDWKLKFLKKKLFLYIKHTVRVRTKCLANLINIVLEIGTKPDEEEIRLLCKVIASYDRTSLELEEHLKIAREIIKDEEETNLVKIIKGA